MSPQIEHFIGQLIEDPSLRDEFGRAPSETARRAGLDLADDDLTALQSVDWSDERIGAAASGRHLLTACGVSDVNAKENIVPIRWD